MEKVIKLENVDQYNNLYGLETLHRWSVSLT